MNLTYISKHLNDQEKCIAFLEEKRWNNKPTCPYCNSNRCSSKKNRYTCTTCKNSFSVTVGTVFENTKLPLYKWFMAISIILSAKKGVSSLQLSRDIHVNKNTAWLMQTKIRTAIEKNELGTLFGVSKSGKKNVPSRFGKRFICKPHSKRKIFRFKYSDLMKPGIFTLSFKRSVIGQFHQIDEFYLSRYLSELDFKAQCRSKKDYGYACLLSILLLLELP
ncbi:MAG: hypothetical protein CSA03_04285 [Bacteroidetes bacterium]|nr:MAG: hypothetical protein CSA03_04285 [Bacteroidota bacterium]